MKFMPLLSAVFGVFALHTPVVPPANASDLNDEADIHSAIAQYQGNDGWAVGYALGYATQTEAERQALAECNSEGQSECRIVKVYTGPGCIALAKASNTAGGVASTTTASVATERALQQCQNAGGTDCTVTNVACVEQAGGDFPKISGSALLREADIYSAIAEYRGNDGWEVGYALGYATEAEAERQALAECNSKGQRECRIVDVYTGPSCAAIAKASNNTGGIVYLQPTESAATEEALLGCQNAGGTNCTVTNAACVEQADGNFLEISGSALLREADIYSAIAEYQGNDGWAVGYALGYATEAEAERQALAECNSKGQGECRIVEVYTGPSCTALAKASNNAGGIAYLQPTESAATEGALRQCQNEGGTDCSVTDVACVEQAGGDFLEISDSALLREAVIYSAIAEYQDNDSWAAGYALGYATQAEAERQALAGCNSKIQSECRIVEVYTGPSCAALAKASNTAGGIAYQQPTESAASEEALQACQDAGGTDCTVTAADCVEQAGGDFPEISDSALLREADIYSATAVINGNDYRAFGYALGYATEAEAERQALAECNSQGQGECSILNVYPGPNCIAFSKLNYLNMNSIAMETNYPTESAAIEASLLYCQPFYSQPGTQSCVVIDSACVGQGGHSVRF